MNDKDVSKLTVVISPVSGLESDAYRIEYLQGNHNKSQYTVTIYCGDFRQVNGFCIMEDVRTETGVAPTVKPESSFYSEWGTYNGPSFSMRTRSACLTEKVAYGKKHKSKVIKERDFLESTSYEDDEVPVWFHKTKEEAQKEVDENQYKLNEEEQKEMPETLKKAKENYVEYKAYEAWYFCSAIVKGFRHSFLHNKEKWLEKWSKKNPVTDFSRIYEWLDKKNVEVNEEA